MIRGESRPYRIEIRKISWSYWVTDKMSSHLQGLFKKLRAHQIERFHSFNSSDCIQPQLHSIVETWTQLWQQQPTIIFFRLCQLHQRLWQRTRSIPDVFWKEGEKETAAYDFLDVWSMGTGTSLHEAAIFDAGGWRRPGKEAWDHSQESEGELQE